MSMEKKDCLHLYLGCDVMVKYYHSEKWEGPMTFTIRLFAESQNTGKFSYHPEQFKPILRPLSDMTDEEKYDYQIRRSKITDGIHPVYLLVDTPLSFKYLLSKHFDLFGLIESGLAIDATKLNAGKTNT